MNVGDRWRAEAEQTLARIKACAAKQEQSRRYGPAACRAEQADAILRLIERVEADMQTETEREMLHRFLQGAAALIDPEEHPTLSQGIAAVLTRCDEAERCVPPGTVGSPAERGTPQWQPISTAPKDGTPVLTRSQNAERRWCDPAVLYFVCGRWRTRPDDDPLTAVYHQPIVWMPLPAPPGAGAASPSEESG